MEARVQRRQRRSEDRGVRAERPNGRAVDGYDHDLSGVPVAGRGARTPLRDRTEELDRGLRTAADHRATAGPHDARLSDFCAVLWMCTRKDATDGGIFPDQD